jgi:hypothetical protein
LGLLGLKPRRDAVGHIDLASSLDDSLQ